MSSQASPDLVWGIVKNNSSFLIRRDGAQFSRESNNITNRNTLKYSGLASRKSVGVNLQTENTRSTKAKKAVDFRRKHRVVVTKQSRSTRKPEHANAKFPLTVSMKRLARTLLSELSAYRPDLKNAALAKAVRLVQSVKNVRQSEAAANLAAEKRAAEKAK